MDEYKEIQRNAAFLQALASLFRTYDAELFINDERELRINIGASNVQVEPDLRGDAFFLDKSETADTLDKKFGGDLPPARDLEEAIGIITDAWQFEVEEREYDFQNNPDCWEVEDLEEFARKKGLVERTAPFIAQMVTTKYL